jgi:4-hydroxy-3-polyprenylbenzoate decarboxylase
MRIFVGISGASGSIYGGHLLRELIRRGQEVTACFSNGAVEVIRFEGHAAGLDLGGVSREQVLEAFFQRYDMLLTDLKVVQPENMGHTFSSGSSLVDAAIICPCSMSTVACIAAGITRNLIHRVADVMLKESRPLVGGPPATAQN